jgi:hypothetical protein
VNPLQQILYAVRKPTSTSQDLRGGSLLALRIAEQSFIQEKYDEERGFSNAFKEHVMWRNSQK